MPTLTKETALFKPNQISNDITTAGQKADHYIAVNSSGVMVADMRDGSATPETVTGRNVLIDSDSVDIRDGRNVLASFGEQTVLGSSDTLHQEITSERNRFIYNDKVYAYMSPDKIFAENMEVNSSYYVGEYSIRQTRDKKLVIGRRR